jgi:hypothetical protein
VGTLIKAHRFVRMFWGGPGRCCFLLATPPTGRLFNEIGYKCYVACNKVLLLSMPYDCTSDWLKDVI